jgi:hypothetical protein
LVAEELLHKVDKYRSWVDSGGGSDYNPIFIQVEKVDEKPSSPFKFNLIWLVEEKFNELVRREWKAHGVGMGLLANRQFANILKDLKKKVTYWSTDRSKKRDNILKGREKAISNL